MLCACRAFGSAAPGQSLSQWMRAPLSSWRRRALIFPAKPASRCEQVPQWEHYQVVVALGAQARKALPVRPDKTIYFTWSVKDPADVDGPPEAVHAAFESACQSLEIAH